MFRGHISECTVWSLHYNKCQPFFSCDFLKVMKMKITWLLVNKIELFKKRIWVYRVYSDERTVINYYGNLLFSDGLWNPLTNNVTRFSLKPTRKTRVPNFHNSIKFHQREVIEFSSISRIFNHENFMLLKIFWLDNTPTCILPI